MVTLYFSYSSLHNIYYTKFIINGICQPQMQHLNCFLIIFSQFTLKFKVRAFPVMHLPRTIIYILNRG